ncbi:MAG: biopolymer transporter ExbD [Candidatus Eisenbacteria bacterium]|uniref:Biopolymer transporter ExbD n=1 Tax=Eiseniibacteriota bacterium TaxID=2212470 RepID=A0A956SE93_UNCEI|nr:biopolymer transporter ExbD [Candidatus Eisenbacteria bacterium]MCB9462640.1 biopolymer transporter ExbD [Candidatus Eisenbacteria bacterium]
MAIKKKTQQLGEISQASLSDIAFLLLVFFIATTIFPTEQGIPLILPGATATTKQINRKNVMVITVDAAGQVFVDDQAFPLKGLKDEVKRRTGENPNLVVSIETSPDAKYEAMVDVLDEVKLANAERISIKMFRG